MAQQNVTKEALEKMVTLQKGYIDQGLSTKQPTFTTGNGLSLIDNVLSITLDHTPYKIVTSLPATPSAADKNKIFLMLQSGADSGNTYIEYLWVEVGGTGRWEQIGEWKPEIDFSPYVKWEDIVYKARTLTPLGNSNAHTYYRGLSFEKGPVTPELNRRSFVGFRNNQFNVLSQLEESNTAEVFVELINRNVARNLGIYKIQVQSTGIISGIAEVTTDDIVTLGFSSTTAMNQAINAVKSALETKIADETRMRTTMDESLTDSLNNTIDRVVLLENKSDNPMTVTEAQALFNKVYGES